jgi:hypothetical protein
MAACTRDRLPEVAGEGDVDGARRVVLEKAGGDDIATQVLPRDLHGSERKPQRARYSNTCSRAADKPQVSPHVSMHDVEKEQSQMTAGPLATVQSRSSGQPRALAGHRLVGG